MHALPEQDDEELASLAVVLPLALAGFVVAAGCWTLFAVAGVHVKAQLALSSVQFGVLLAAPMAVSALLAIPAGLCARRFGARAVMLFCLTGLALCMALLLVANSYPAHLIVAAGLGLAGGFYSAGLHYVTSHCRQRLGLVLGIFGAGVTGAAFNYYLVPLFHEAYSWQGVPLAYLTVLLLVIALVLLLTDARQYGAGEGARSTGRPVSELLRNGRSLPLCLYFGVVAGSFFALALWLPDFLSAQFGLQLGAGARMAQWFVIPGALAQIAGGALSDRLGSTPVTAQALIASLVGLFVLSYPPMTLHIRGVEGDIVVNFALPVILERGLVILLGVALGCAMGSLQREVILANRAEASLFAGLLLVSACSVAFLLPVAFGAINQWLGIRTAVFMLLFGLLGLCLLMFAVGTRHRVYQYLS